MTVREQILAASHPVALTGAGISAPSGIPTFQGKYKGRDIRAFLTREYCSRFPQEFYTLYCDMVRWTDKQPNAAHLALAQLALPIITQNIDGLHTAAGSHHIIEMHGSLRFLRCTRCGRTLDAHEFCERFARQSIGALECENCGGLLDSDVVLYGDDVRGLYDAIDLVEACDLLVVVGTSLSTYPAAALPDLARQSGAKVLLINDDCIAAFAE